VAGELAAGCGVRGRGPQWRAVRGWRAVRWRAPGEATRDEVAPVRGGAEGARQHEATGAGARRGATPGEW